MTVATFHQLPSSNTPTTTTTQNSAVTTTAKIRKLSLASYSSSQSNFASKKLRLLSPNNSNNTMASSTPPATTLSRSSSTSSSSSRSRPSLTLDLSNLPALSKPSPPTNTLIITELHNLLIFQPPCLDAIRSTITSVAPLNSFSPLPSFRRIVCSFTSTEDAVKVRQNLENATSNIFSECGLRTRIYFGEHTPIESTEEAKRRKLLEAPHAQKLFFISPPPSPPHGWVMRNEEPPNKEVHASDLADALAKLGTTATSSEVSDPLSPVSVAEDGNNNNIINNNSNKETGRTSSWPSSAGAGAGATGRSRSSTLIFHPNDHGGSPNLPAVMVVDTSIEDDDDDDDVMSLDGKPQTKKIFAHTSRPPVELMG